MKIDFFRRFVFEGCFRGLNGGIFSLNKSFLVFFFCLSFFSQATIVKISELSVMAKKSDVIVQAQVISQTVKEDIGGRLITTTMLKVLESFKGAKKGEIKTVYQVGGELKNKVLKVVGAHQYKVGEELILFSLRHGDMLVSYGVGLGKFRILRDKKNVQVVEDFHDLVVLKEGYVDKYETPTPRRFASLDEFKNAIDEALYASKYKIYKQQPMKLKL